jgi:hypothetical protein
MYLTEIRSRSKNKTYRCFLLRETYREGGKVKNRTLANLSHGTPREIEAIRLALALLPQLGLDFHKNKTFCVFNPLIFLTGIF